MLDRAESLVHHVASPGGLQMMRKLVAVLMCLLLPSVLLAGNPGAAMGTFNGDASLNGRPVPSSTAIFPGDKLVTGRNGTAYVSRPGFTMVVDGQSSAELLSSGARMLDGSAEVTLRRGSEIQLADIHVSPVSDAARLKIVARPGAEMIGALSGDLQVRDASTSVTVPQGKALYAKAAPPKEGSGGNVEVVEAVHVGGFNWVIAGIIIGGIAGAVGGVLIYEHWFCTNSASPSKPCL